MIRTFENKDLERIMEIGNLAWKNIYAMFRESYGDELFRILVPDEPKRAGFDIRHEDVRYYKKL